MGKKKNKNVQPDGKDRVIFDQINGRVSYQGVNLGADSIRAFVGLAGLQKMIRFGIDASGKYAVIQRVPEGIESFYAEVARLCEKYKNDPAKGFQEIRRTTLFAESVLAKEQEGDR